LGASDDGKTLAFACGDPSQEQNYGITLGDAIQHTWLYDVATASASVLSWGNLNDECHTFSASGDALWVCRRANFTASGSADNYRIAKLSLPCGETELPTAPSATELELHPRPSADGSTLYYTLITIAAGQQSRGIMRKALPDGAPELIRPSATLAQLSPDGTRLLFADHTQAGALVTTRLDGTDPIKVASHAGTNASYSPDGSRIAYLWDETQTCHHIEVVLADGSQADTPTKLRDCGSAFITELAWLNVP
jgi:Tol biopolymer transport system component